MDINVSREFLEDLLHHLTTSDSLLVTDNVNEVPWVLDNTEYIQGLKKILPEGPYTRIR